ncbi:bifunctional adenosylcobinamide kinase/adenosylcobinamide-phosphate guanylyltransferase [Sporosarcina sp. FSL K6-1522]|uniref:bifunctional adenosylcobinamide kinase/adenosylcobinamide-phosphate guanylyltransferase n=1 Tax=Sporosarcina sp. FSL K6-1522 TaxID=2921554 RepID=UPI00315A5BEB
MVRGKLTFICGGVRSGKSAYAERILVGEAQENGSRLVYIASGTATDLEMQARIDKHRHDRADDNWTTLEQPTQLEAVLSSIQQDDYVLWDCLTTWLANELYAGWEVGTPCIQQPGCMAQKVEQLYGTIDTMRQKVTHLVIVSNEVLDELPLHDEETEIYRSWIGQIHQQLVVTADTAIEMDYGMATVWKNER